MSLLDKLVVLLPPYATKSIYTVVKEFEHKGTVKVRLRHPETGSEHAKPVSQIRIAEDAEIAAGHRIDAHKVFEEWFKFQPFYAKLVYIHGDRIFDFDAPEQTYRCLPVNISWLTWQHKEKQLEGHRFAHDALAQVISKQKGALDRAYVLIDEWRSDDFSHDKSERHVAWNCAVDLEHTLKGGAE